MSKSESVRKSTSLIAPNPGRKAYRLAPLVRYDARPTASAILSWTKSARRDGFVSNFLSFAIVRLCSYAAGATRQTRLMSHALLFNPPFPPSPSLWPLHSFSRFLRCIGFVYVALMSSSSAATLCYVVHCTFFSSGGHGFLLFGYSEKFFMPQLG